jgi:hypothetical protein
MFDLYLSWIAGFTLNAFMDRFYELYYSFKCKTMKITNVSWFCKFT